MSPLQRFLRSRICMFHTSAKVAMVPNPDGPLLPAIPRVQKPGVTYNVGRNKTKRERKVGARKHWSKPA